MSELTVGSLFSGIGGLEYGLELTGGFRTIWHSEIEPYCCEVLEQHWPGVPNLGDITKIDWGAVERPDVICGGFPCQDISLAGKGAGIAEGTRSGLWFEFARAIGALRPRYVVIENVGALVVRGLDIVLADLAALRYDAEWAIVPAAAVGAPHRRERLFIVAWDAGLGDALPERCRAAGLQHDTGPEPAAGSAGDMAYPRPAERRTGDSGGCGAEGQLDVHGGRAEGAGGLAERREAVADAERPERWQDAQRGSQPDGQGAGREQEAGRPECDGEPLGNPALKPEREPHDGTDTVATRGDARRIPGGASGDVGDAAGVGRGEGRPEHAPRERGSAPAQPGSRGVAQGDAVHAGREEQCRPLAVGAQQPAPERAGRIFQPYRRSTFWDDAEYIMCGDGKQRATQPGVCLLAHGIPRRVAKLKALGNAVVPEVARYVGECILAFHAT